MTDEKDEQPKKPALTSVDNKLKVVSIKPDKPQPKSKAVKEKPKANPKIVALLKDMLKRAEEGTIVEISYVLSTTNKKKCEYETVGTSLNPSKTYILMQELEAQYYQEVICEDLGLDY